MIWWTEKDMIYLPPMIKLEYLKKIRVRWIILAILLISVWIVMGNPRLGGMVFPFDLSMGIGYAISFLLLVPFFRRGLFYLW